MKALILDDSPLKIAKISRSLQSCGITSVEYVTDQQRGMEKIKSSLQFRRLLERSGITSLGMWRRNFGSL